MKCAAVLLLVVAALSADGKPYDKGAGHVKDRIFRFDPVVPQNIADKEHDYDDWKLWDAVEPKKDTRLDKVVTEKTKVDHKDHKDPCRNVYCHYGRVCKEDLKGNGVCVCAGKDYCQGHKKVVCGTDGVSYTSHCELHRMACVKKIHIGIDHSGKKCKSQTHKAVKEHSKKSKSHKTESKVSKKSEQKNKKHKDVKVTIEKLNKHKSKKERKHKISKKVLYDMKDDIVTVKPIQKVEHVCSDLEWKTLKDKLLDYHCTRVGEKDCLKDSIRKQFVANIMFNYYDGNTNQLLSEAELIDIEHRDHLEKLSADCHLVDLLSFDDKDGDGNISMEEFYKAFHVPTVVLEENLKVFNTMVNVGNSVELKCDIRGATDIIWKRSGADLSKLDSKEIKVFKDGSLYIQNLGLHHIGNYTCQDKYDEHVIQTHILRVQVPPKVTVSPKTQFHLSGSDVTIKCHAEGIPEPQILWEMNEVDIPDDYSQKNSHYDRQNNNATLIVRAAKFTKDTGAYKCKAKNDAGFSEAISTLFVEESLNNKYIASKDEKFLVFHDYGYTVYDPSNCHLEHVVPANFNKFKIRSDGGDKVDTMCEEKKGCKWGSSVNVGDRFVYVSQPSLNRIIVVNVADRGNPVEVITTDKVPVSLHYVAHLDQVWVLCWNSEKDTGSKTPVIIRQASKDGKHHAIHTQPVGNHFDLVKDVFLPTANDLHHHFQHGYVVHNEQRGLHKLDLESMKYVKVIDLNKYNCVPTSVSYVPMGGKILVFCHSPLGESEKTSQLVIDYITDMVLKKNKIHGQPYVSPDGRNVITIDEVGDNISVFKVTDEGDLKHVFDEYTNLHVSDVSFFPSERGRGYDFFATSVNKNDVLYVNLESGKVEMIEGVGKAMDAKDWPWNKRNRAIVGAGVFGKYLVTPSKDSVVVIDGERRHVQCEWNNIYHGNVLAWVLPKSQ